MTAPVRIPAELRARVAPLLAPEVERLRAERQQAETPEPTSERAS